MHVFIDGTERPIQRDKDYDKQKENYSGKKKRHTKKNIVITDEEKKILILTDTESGSKHDKKLLDESEIMEKIPDGVSGCVDLGFNGVDNNPAYNLIHRDPSDN